MAAGADGTRESLAAGRPASGQEGKPGAGGGHSVSARERRRRRAWGFRAQGSRHGPGAPQDGVGSVGLRFCVTLAPPPLRPRKARKTAREGAPHGQPPSHRKLGWNCTHATELDGPGWCQARRVEAARREAQEQELFTTKQQRTGKNKGWISAHFQHSNANNSGTERAVRTSVTVAESP